MDKPAFQFWTSSLLNCERIHFCCCKPQICSVLEMVAKETNTDAEAMHSLG